MAVDFGTGYIDVEPRVDKAAAETAMKKDLGATLQSAGKKMVGTGAAMTAGLTLPIVAFGKSAISAFQESTAVAAQTQAVIKSTGGAAGVTAREVETLATRLSQMSGVDDELIAQSQNMLLTFTNVKDVAGPMGDVFSDSTRLALDMSTALGTDAKSAAMMLGKALNDPTAGLSRLSRSGVLFTEQQKKQVEVLQKSGDTLGAQRVILEEVAKEFGGSAKAFGLSEAGAGAKRAVNMENAMESMGETIESVVAPILDKLTGFLQKAVAWFSELPGPVKAGIVILLALVAAAGPVLVILGSLALAVGAITAPILIGVAAFVALIAVIALLAANWSKVVAAAQPVVAFLSSLFIPIWEALKAVWEESILPALRDLWAAVQALWPILKVLLVVALAPIIAAFFVLMKALPVVIKILGFLIRVVAGVIRVIAEAVGWIGDKLGGAFETAWGIAKRVFGYITAAWEGVRDVAVGVWDAIWGAIRTVVNSIAGAWNSTIGALSFRIPDWVPGIGGSGFDVPDIPTLGRGGIVLKPTLAALAERGPEAVLPLSALGQLVDGPGRGRMRGTLTLTPESRAYVEMIGDDDAAGRARHAKVLRRMGAA